MPNWTYLIVSFFYDLALAMTIGGTVALGALTAPTLFRQLERPQAGAIFGLTLRKFARVRLVASIVVIVAASIKHLVWETHVTGTSSPRWIAIRWLAIGVMTAQVAYEILIQEKAMNLARTGPEASEADRQGFARLHTRAERLLKIALVAALVAMFFG